MLSLQLAVRMVSVYYGLRRRNTFAGVQRTLLLTKDISAMFCEFSIERGPCGVFPSW